MELVWNLCNTDDLGALLILAVLTTVIGHVMSGENAKACRLSWRFGGGTFLLLSAVRILEDGADEPFEMCGIALRGIVAGTFVAGLTMIVMAPLKELDTQLMTVCDAVRQRVLGWKRAYRQRQTDLQEQQAEIQRQHEWQVRAAEEQRLQAEITQASLAEALQRAADHKRREAARLKCQLKWDQHARILRSHFPRDRVAEYFSEFMTSEHSPEEVEGRSEQLLKVLDAILVAYGAGRERHFGTHLELVEHFRQRRADISAAGYDTDTTDTLLAMATIEERKALEEMLK